MEAEFEWIEQAIGWDAADADAWDGEGDASRFALGRFPVYSELARVALAVSRAVSLTSAWESDDAVAQALDDLEKALAVIGKRDRWSVSE